MKSLYLTLLVLVFSISLAGQDRGSARISGSVVDQAGVPVAGATIVAQLKNRSVRFTAVTDKKGFYVLDAQTGTFEMRASYSSSSGDLVSSASDVSLTLNTTRQLNLVLQPAGIRENVDVSISAGTAQAFSAVSKTVDSVSREEIENRAETNIADSIRSVPGFRIQQLGGLGRTVSIKTRGLRNQDTAILLDGQRLRDPAAITGDASPFISDLSSVNVGRIEVLRGSGSSVYGTNAIGGVIDVQTARASQGFQSRISGEYGNLGFSRFNGTTGYGTSDGKFGFTTGLSRYGVTRGIDGSDDANNTSLRTRFDANLSNAFSISGKIFYSDSYVRLNSSPDTFGTTPLIGIINADNGVNFVTDADDPDNFQRSDFLAGQLNASFVVSDKIVLSGYYHGLRTGRENENGGLGAGFQPFGGTQFSFFNGSIQDIGVKADVYFSRSVRLIAGYEYELENYFNEGVGPTATGDFFTRIDQSSNMAFGQVLGSALNDRLQLAGGIRVQSFRLSSPEFSLVNAPYGNLVLDNPPSALTLDGAISYYVRESKTKLRAHVGNGYRVPSLYERFGSFYSSFSQNFTAIGDPNLEPERSIAFDAGIDQTIAGDRVNLSATYFYTRLLDTIGYGNTVPDIGMTTRPFGGYENTKGGIARGLELSAGINPTRSTNIFTSYTFTNSDQREPQVSGSGILRTLGIPDHRFTVLASQRISNRLTLSFDLEAGSNYLAPIFSNQSFSTVIYRFDGRRRADLAARYDLPILDERAKASFFAAFENVFGDTYFENGFVTQGRTARAGMAIEF